jgi:plasmid stability protein
MSQILVRNLSPETVERLRAQAKRNRRSLEAEVRVIIEQAGRPKYTLEDFQRMTAEIRAAAGPQRSDSADLIREDRER